eukprot:312273-Hanusia_phi.AAC.4
MRDDGRNEGLNEEKKYQNFVGGVSIIGDRSTGRAGTKIRIRREARASYGELGKQQGVPQGRRQPYHVIV